MVKRSGAHTAKPNEPTELVQFLVQRLRDYHDGNDLIPKKTAFEAGNEPWFGWVEVCVEWARALPPRAPMAQVGAVVVVVVPRLFLLGLLHGPCHLSLLKARPPRRPLPPHLLFGACSCRPSALPLPPGGLVGGARARASRASRGGPRRWPQSAGAPGAA